jgi:cell wall-associated NlpC family hydrolase
MAHFLSACLYSDLLGKPFEEGGRGPDTYDCVGLAIEIQRRRGISVPDFISSEAELHRQLSQGGMLEGCRKLKAAVPGCVVLVKMPEGHHLGTMIDTWRILHTTAQTKGVVVERILGPMWVRRILGYYEVGSAEACQGEVCE